MSAVHRIDDSRLFSPSFPRPPRERGVRCVFRRCRSLSSGALSGRDEAALAVVVTVPVCALADVVVVDARLEVEPRQFVVIVLWGRKLFV